MRFLPTIFIAGAYANPDFWVSNCQNTATNAIEMSIGLTEAYMDEHHAALKPSFTHDTTLGEYTNIIPGNSLRQNLTDPYYIYMEYDMVRPTETIDNLFVHHGRTTVFKCKYPRVVTLTDNVSLPPPTDPSIAEGIGHFAFDFEVTVSGGRNTVTITPQHGITNLANNVDFCEVSCNNCIDTTLAPIRPVHSWNQSLGLCKDNRLGTTLTEGPPTVIDWRTFHFNDNQTPQTHDVRCDIHVESSSTMANVPNCDCYTNDQCNPPVWSPPNGLPGDYVLMLNSVNSHNIPGVINTNGGVSFDIGFQYEAETEVDGSCSLVFQGLNYIFGGNINRNQISRVEECELRRIGSLSFDLYRGGCANANDGDIYLCFSENEANKCRKAQAPLGVFNEVQNANYYHKDTRISASSEHIFVVGSYHGPSNNKTELLDLSDDTWRIEADYPYANDISFAPTIFLNNVFIVFGGWVNRQPPYIQTRIAGFNPTSREWSLLGHLNQARRGHNVIQVGVSSVLVVGGFASRPTEHCSLNEDSMSCSSHENSETNNYFYYPELFHVEAGYCSNN